MRLFWLLLAFAAPAHADLYRWIDPETGSVKLSSLPPSNPAINAEIVRFGAPAPLPKPPASAPAAKPAPSAPPAVSGLEQRWRALLAQLAALTPEDFNRGADGLRRQVEAYEAVRSELDRLDPPGVARRNAEAAPLFERLREGFTAQSNPKNRVAP